jgi:hypothetical protein
MPEALSEQNDKLFMVLIHRTHDVSSNKLKPYFAQSKEILVCVLSCASCKNEHMRRTRA